MGFITRSIIAVAALVLGGLGWLGWPVYTFFAHSGDAPMPPWGWVDLPKEAPAQEWLADPAYAEAGTMTLKALQAHRKAIGSPGLTAAVAVDRDVVWQGAVGWADVAANVPMGRETILRIGSTSKSVTATALARMVDRGEIDLDAPIATYLGPLENPSWNAITPRMLASHSSGMPHYEGMTGSAEGLYQLISLRAHYDRLSDSVKLFEDADLLFEPGSDFEYSSLGTVLLGATMAAAAGRPYEDIVRKEVLEPAGMTSTVVAPKQSKDLAEAATFYALDGDRVRPWRPVDLSHRLPGGGWASTSTDLVRMGSKWFDDTYISAQTRDAFWTPQTLSTGEVNEQDYALGWRWREWEIKGAGLARNANHGGVSKGAQSWLLVYPDYDMAIAFNMNGRTETFAPFAPFHEEIFRQFAPVAAAERGASASD